MTDGDVQQIIMGPDDVPEKGCPYVIIRDEVSFRYIIPDEKEFSMETLSLWGCYSYGCIYNELAEARKRVGVPIEITNIETSITWVTRDGKQVHTNDAGYRGKYLREYRSLKKNLSKERRYSTIIRYREPNEKKEIYDTELIYSEVSLNDIIREIYKKYEGKLDVTLWNIDIEVLHNRTF